MTGWGGTQRLPRLIGKAKALEVFVTAEKIHASEAMRIGLVESIVEDPVAEAVRQAGMQLDSNAHSGQKTMRGEIIKQPSPRATAGVGAEFLHKYVDQDRQHGECGESGSQGSRI